MPLTIERDSSRTRAAGALANAGGLCFPKTNSVGSRRAGIGSRIWRFHQCRQGPAPAGGGCVAGMIAHLEPGVEGLVTSITQLDGVPDGSVDYVFSSNCFEHVSQPDLVDCLAQLRRKMKPGAMISIVQPNFKYCFRDYFDDYTHVAIYTAQGLSDLLAANGFRVVRCVPRFMPLTLKSRVPAHPWLIRLYLMSPFKPLAGQMLISAIR